MTLCKKLYKTFLSTALIGLPYLGFSQIEGVWRGESTYKKSKLSSLICVAKKKEGNQNIYTLRCCEKTHLDYTIRFSYELIQFENSLYIHSKSMKNISLESNGKQLEKSLNGKVPFRIAFNSTALCFVNLKGKIQKENGKNQLKLACHYGHEWKLYRDLPIKTQIPKQQPDSKQKIPCLDSNISPIKTDTIYADKNASLSMKILDFQNKDDDFVTLFINSSKVFSDRNINEPINISLSNQKNTYDVTWCAQSTGSIGKNTGKFEIYSDNSLIHSQKVILDLNQRYRFLIMWR